MAGRPTKYNEAMQKAAEEYVNGGYIARGDGVPSNAGLARFLGVVRGTLWDWAENHPQFSVTLDEIQAEQHRIALGKGLSNEYNSTICKLVLANHGYSDKQEIDNRSSDGSMSPKPTVIQLVGPDDEGADTDPA